MRSWTSLHAAFWSSLARHLAWDPMTSDHRAAALHWLGEAAAAPPRSQKRREIVRALEDGILDVLKLFKERNIPPDKIKRPISLLLIPLVEGQLLDELDSTFRRLLGYILPLSDEGRVLKELACDSREDLPALQMSEMEEDQTALLALRNMLRGNRSLSVEPGPTWMKLTLTKKIGTLPQPVAIPITVPYINLVLADDKEIQPFLLDQLTGYFSLVDPALAEKIRELRDSLLSDEPSLRREGLQRLCFAYLYSTYFDLKRDFAHGLRRLCSSPLAVLDAWCGIPLLVEDHNLADTLRAVFTTDPGRGHLASESTKATLQLLIGLRLKDQLAAFIDQLNMQLNQFQAQGGSLEEGLGTLAQSAQTMINVFDSLWHFIHLLLVGRNTPTQAIKIGDQVWPLEEWVRAYIAFMLECGTTAGRTDRFDQTPRFLPSYEYEIQRRWIHARTMRLAVWVAASPSHVQELSARTQEHDQVIGEWLIRSLLITDRIIPIISNDLSWSPEDLRNHLTSVGERLGMKVDPEFYPDQLNPFLYGPEEYDHAIAMLLTILTYTWDHLGSTPQKGARPYWWSDTIGNALRAIAERSETEAEAMFRKGRDQEKPNRLAITLEYTPQELARRLLHLNGELSS